MIRKVPYGCRQVLFPNSAASRELASPRHFNFYSNFHINFHVPLLADYRSHLPTAVTLWSQLSTVFLPLSPLGGSRLTGMVFDRDASSALFPTSTCITQKSMSSNNRKRTRQQKAKTFFSPPSRTYDLSYTLYALIPFCFTHEWHEHDGQRPVDPGSSVGTS